jgi:transcriptional regulator NrdR family protein
MAIVICPYCDQLTVVDVPLIDPKADTDVLIKSKETCDHCDNEFSLTLEATVYLTARRVDKNGNELESCE